MVQKSFITEAYTNLCKDKDTYFYNFLQEPTDKSSNTYIPDSLNPQIFDSITADECRKECDSQDCALYTLAHTFSDSGKKNVETNSGTCNLYSESNLDTISKILVDCGNKSNYKGIPQYVGALENGPANTANFGIAGIGPSITGNIGETKGYGYVDPDFFRKNVNKFKHTNYAHDKTQLIIDAFKEVKETIKEVADFVGVLKGFEDSSTEFKTNVQTKSQKLEDSMGTAGEAEARSELIDLYKTKINESDDMEYSPLLDFIIEKRVKWSDSKNGGVTFAYTAPIYVADKLQTIKKYIHELEVYSDINASTLFSKLIPKTEYELRVKSKDGEDSLHLGKFSLAEILPEESSKDFINAAPGENFIVTVTLGKNISSWDLGDDSVNFKSERRPQLYVTKLFSEIYKKEKNLAGEKENVEAKRKKLFQTIFVYGLLFAISIIIFVTSLFKPSIIKPKYLIILFILIIALIIFMNYYVEIKNFLNFKDYLYS